MIPLILGLILLLIEITVLLLLIPIVLASLIPLFIWSKKKNKVNMKKFIGNNNNLQPKANRNIIIVKQIILIISLVLLIIALARPQKGFIWHEANWNLICNDSIYSRLHNF